MVEMDLNWAIIMIKLFCRQLGYIQVCEQLDYAQETSPQIQDVI